MACRCGSRPKKNAPPLSIIRLSDVRLPIKSLTGVTLFTLPTPPVFSAIWAEDTETFCKRNPDNLYLEFAPYGASELTAALKRLWAKNCECKPVKGQYLLRVKFTSSGMTQFSGFVTSTRFVNIQREGITIGIRLLEATDGRRATTTVFGYVFSNQYASEVNITGEVVEFTSQAKIVTTYVQTLVSQACFPGAIPVFPLKPTNLPDPYPPTIPPSLPPDAFLPPDKKKPKPPPPPPPPECCECC